MQVDSHRSEVAVVGSETIKNPFAPLVAYSLFIWVFCISATVTSLALTYIVTTKFDAVTKISYRPQEVTRLKLQEQSAFGAPVQMPPFKIINQTLQDLIKNPALLRQTVLEFGLHLKEPRLYEGPWYYVVYKKFKDFVMDASYDILMIIKYGSVIEEDPIDKAVETLAGNVKIKNKDSYLFFLYVRDKKPERAAVIADYLSERLVDWLREQDREPGELKRAQLQELRELKREEVAWIRSQIKRLLGDHRVAAVSVETEHIGKQIGELEIDLTHVHGDIELHKAELNEIDEKLSRKPGVGENAVRGRGQPLIQPEDLKRLESQRLQEEVELEGLEAKQELIASDLNVLKERKAKLPVLKAELDNLNLQLQNAERDLEQLTDAYQEANVRATGRVSEVHLLHRAAIPTVPVLPIKIYHVGLSFVLSVFFAVGIAYLAAYITDRRWGASDL